MIHDGFPLARPRVRVCGVLIAQLVLVVVKPLAGVGVVAVVDTILLFVVAVLG